VQVDYVFAGLIVSDRDLAADWYARVLGRPADMLPNDAEAAWQVAGSASLYLLADPGRAGRSVCTVVVPDLKTELARIMGRGIVAGPVSAVAEAGWKAELTDPDGNVLALVQLSLPASPDQVERDETA
jgi:predicted enzyme related to lactoylglutathione lyase